MALPFPKEAKTLKEAQAKAQELLKQSNIIYKNQKHPIYRGISAEDFGVADLGNLDLPAANTLIKKLTQFQAKCDKLQIPRLRGIKVISTDNVPAAMGDGVLNINPKILNKIDKIDKILKEVAEDGDPKNIAASLFQNQGREKQIEVTLDHEFMHHIHQNIEGAEKYLSTLSRRVGKKNLPTTYSGASSYEMVSEGYAILENSKGELVDFKVKEAINNVLNKRF